MVETGRQKPMQGIEDKVVITGISSESLRPPLAAASRLWAGERAAGLARPVKARKKKRNAPRVCTWQANGAGASYGSGSSLFSSARDA